MAYFTERDLKKMKKPDLYKLGHSLGLPVVPSQSKYLLMYEIMYMDLPSELHPWATIEPTLQSVLKQVHPNTGWTGNAVDLITDPLKSLLDRFLTQSVTVD